MRLSRIIPAALLGALALAGGASAATPRFAVFDVHTDLAGPSQGKTTVEIPGLSRANALRATKLLG